VVRVVVKCDLVRIPEPVATVANIVGGDAEIESAKPEASRTASREVEDMAAAERPGEMTVLPGMIEVVVGIAAPGIVADPLAVGVNVWCIGVTPPVSERVIGLIRSRLAVEGRRSASGNVPAHTTTTVFSATMLRYRGKRKTEQNCDQPYRYFHVVSSGKNLRKCAPSPFL
jgi:hypothetical protein